MRLDLHDIHKSFGTTRVLAGVGLSVHGGEVLALCGENGAGKSTLTRVIAGAHEPDTGHIEIDGETVALKRPQDAMAHGIQVIYQEFLHNIFPHLSIAENLFMLDAAAEFGRAYVRKAQMAAKARELLERIGLDVDPFAPASSLSVAQLQMLEIAKSMAHDTRVLILDEPTAALDEHESELLFAQVETMRRDGIAIVYISHRLEEVFRLSDRIVVLRNGGVALEGRTAELTERQVVTAMVGKELDDFYPKEHHARDEVVLRLTGAGSTGRFDDVDLTVHAGEVLGIGGVLGCGKGDVLRALFGITPLTTGTLEVEGTARTIRSPKAALRAGLAYITPDRQAEGLALQQSVSHNISLASLRRLSPGGVVRTGAEDRATAGIISGLSVRTPSPRTEVGRLSGGNQQKVLFGRWVLTGPKVLLMEEPTRGVDIGAKAEIYRIINEQAAQGVAVVLVSSDLPELVAMSDRIVVMRAGRVAAELTGADRTQQKVLEHALESAA